MPVVSQLQTGEDAPALKLDPNITLQLDPNVTLELESDVTADEKEDEVLPDDNIFFPDECPLDPSSPSLEPDEGFVPPKAKYRLVTGVTNIVSHVPPCVWVRNASQHKITVVVSRFGPLRTLTGAGVDASASGGGLNFQSETFNVGATKKTIAALAHNEKPGPQTTARFPLWTRSCDAGVVTVFVDGKEVPVIERDRLPAGSVGVFKGEGQEMEVYDHHGRKVNDGMPVLLL